MEQAQYDQGGRSPTLDGVEAPELVALLHGRRVAVLTGQVTEQCILYTALDAYIRHFQVVVPPDGVAHIDEELGRAALRMMDANMRATIMPAQNCLD